MKRSPSLSSSSTLTKRGKQQKGEDNRATPESSVTQGVPRQAAAVSAVSRTSVAVRSRSALSPSEIAPKPKPLLKQRSRSLSVSRRPVLEARPSLRQLVSVAISEEWDRTTLVTSQRTGWSVIAVARLFAVILLLATAFAVYEIGPVFVFGFFGLVDLPDELPECDGTQYIFQCECAPGQEADGASWWKLVTKNHCTQCDEHEFKPARGNWACLACAPFEVGVDNGTECALCPVGTTRRHAPGGSTGSVCMPCPANTYFNGFDGCSTCALDSWSIEGSVGCTACIPGAYKGTSDHKCKSCPQNTFKDPAVLGECSMCSADFFSPRGQVRAAHVFAIRNS
jgi:hypothetical protein